MRLLACLLITLLVSTSSPTSVRAADEATARTLLQLEQKYFGHGFDNNPIDQRLSRLEKLVLGSTSEGTPEERVKTLAASVSESDDGPASTADAGASGEQADASATASENPGSSDAGDNSATADDTTTADTASSAEDPYPRIGALEASILMEVYPSDDINARLGRMEEKAFGHVSDKLELSARSDALEQYAEKKTGKRLFTPTADQQDAFNDDARNQTAQQGGGSSALPKLVNMFSSALLGMPMGGGFAGQMANMGANMAMGPAMNGFSGVRMRQRDQVQQEPEPKQPPSRPEDPAIFEAAPPPSDAKLLTKVGWCEVRIFGQTSPALHLPERLEKLNTELNFEPGKQGMWLMDHVDALLEAVQSRSSTIGMKPETTTTTTTEKKDDDYNEADTLQ